MEKTVINKEAFAFVKTLAANNNRDWFNEHKDQYKLLETGVKEFYQQLMEQMRLHDDIERLKMFRIYRDVRFSKDKTPFKTHFAGSFSRAGDRLRGGYYLRLKPGETFIAAGFWEPNKEDLLRIRKELEMDATVFRKVFSEPVFRKTWGSITGEELKTAPKGFEKDHPDIDLIRKKQFIFVRNFTDAEVFSPDFHNQVNDSFKRIRPYFDLMSDILTTNLNGESLLD
ncbi:DUF2461 domain-containing protein [uncultured Muriicola sp.]|uniref:DUF2461 domain-containing protein n=1 Tax=uncultured Muriicola sp. TaxID=1583102 RepID=UPI002635D707|nr:DUF2461 domain-containing protein [uncultured Muriicola sp.]